MSLFLRIEIYLVVVFVLLIIIRSLINEHNKSYPFFMRLCYLVLATTIIKILGLIFPYANYVNLHYVINCISFVLTALIPCIWVYVILEKHEINFLKKSDYFGGFCLVAILSVATLSVLSPSFGYLFKLNLFGDPVPGLYFDVFNLEIATFGGIAILVCLIKVLCRLTPEEKKDVLFSLAISVLVIGSQLYSMTRSSNLYLVVVTLGIVVYYINFHEERVFTDALTGLNNRNRFRKYFLSLMSASVAQKSNTYLTYIDIDDFKQINDNYGHLMGDLALRTVAESMRDIGDRTHAFLARIGGDEFVMISHHPTVDSHYHMVERLTEILNEKARATLSNIQVSFSVGFTNLNVPKANAADIIKLADRNMYRNKTFKKQQRQALEKEQSATKK